MTGCSLFVRGTARNGHDAREHVRASQYMGGVHVLIGTEVCHHPGQSTGWFTRPFCLPRARWRAAAAVAAAARAWTSSTTCSAWTSPTTCRVSARGGRPEHRGPRGIEHADSALLLGGTRRPAIAGDLLNRRGRGGGFILSSRISVSCVPSSRSHACPPPAFRCNDVQAPVARDTPPPRQSSRGPRQERLTDLQKSAACR